MEEREGGGDDRVQGKDEVPLEGNSDESMEHRDHRR